MKVFIIAMSLLIFTSESHGKVKNYENWIFAEKAKEYTEIYRGFCGDFGEGGSCMLEHASVSIKDCSLSFNEVLSSADVKLAGDTWIATVKGTYDCAATTVYELAKSGLRYKRFYPKKDSSGKTCNAFENFETTYKYYKDNAAVGEIPLGNCKALKL